MKPKKIAWLCTSDRRPSCTNRADTSQRSPRCWRLPSRLRSGRSGRHYRRRRRLPRSCTAQPDTAIVRLGVTGEADEPEAALADNNRQMGQVFQRLDELGIPRADIQTSVLGLHPVREEPAQPGGDAAISGYRATNQVSITIEQVAKAGELLAEVVAAGANQVQGIEFRLNDRDDLLAQARAEAIADARRVAEQLAGAAGVRVGPVVSITDRSADVPGLPVGAAEAADVGHDMPPEIWSSQNGRVVRGFRLRLPGLSKLDGGQVLQAAVWPLRVVLVLEGRQAEAGFSD